MRGSVNIVKRKFYNAFNFQPNSGSKPSNSIDDDIREALRQHLDEEFYFTAYPDLERGLVDPAAHYHLHGWREGRNPSAEFDTNYYLNANPDVAARGMDPFLHYIWSGRTEGRTSKAYESAEAIDDDIREALRQHLDEEFYFTAYPDLERGLVDPAAHYHLHGWREGRNPSAEFDTNYYLNANPDVAASGMDPFLHYIWSGRTEGRTSKAYESAEAIDDDIREALRQHLDEEFYFTAYPDLERGLVDPAAHYHLHGWREGRNPSAEFDTNYYLNANPDVAASGMDPFLHYIWSGRTEGRTSKAYESAEAIDDDIREALRQHLDEEFYFTAYPDLERGLVDPAAHYHLHGWREGRNPSAEFDTNYYLNANPDVAARGMDPFLHYIWSGRTEGRTSKAYESAEAIDDDIREALRQHLDEEFYFTAYPDLERGLVDPAAHYHLHGWREGRNPSAEFDTNYYLNANPDIAASGMDPFLHYIWSGRTEGRTCRRILNDERFVLENAVPARDRAKDWMPFDTKLNTVSDLDVATALHSSFKGIILSISHDDPMLNTGGVQNVINDEREKFYSDGWHYIHICPYQPLPMLSDIVDSSHFQFRVRLNNDLLGLKNLNELIRLFEDNFQHGPRFAIFHHLLGHSLDILTYLMQSLKITSSYFWTHDYFSACTSFALLRNDLSYCDAPPLTSTECRVCCYGAERKEHLERLKSFFDRMAPVIVAPSEFALERWQRTTKFIPSAAIVAPLAKIAFGKGVQRPKKSGSVIKVGFIGGAVYHKGWASFVRLAHTLQSDKRYKFIHLGQPQRGAHYRVIKNIPVNVTRDNRSAMISAIIENDIDIAIFWSIWPETFNFAVHEALAAGCYVIARKASGNIERVLDQYASECSCLVGDESELLNLFTESAVGELLSHSKRKRGTLIIHNGTADIISTMEP